MNFLAHLVKQPFLTDLAKLPFFSQLEQKHRRFNSRQRSCLKDGFSQVNHKGDEWSNFVRQLL